MTTTAIFTNKGGVGKTTFACNLAHALSVSGKRVLLIDADPQANATHLMMRDLKLDKLTGLLDVFGPVARGDGRIKTINTGHSKEFGIDVIHGHISMSLMEDMMAGDWNRATGGDVRGINTTLTIKDLVSRVKDDYDEIIIDCAPALGSLNRAALIAADRFISPVGNDMFSLAGMSNVAQWIGRWKTHWENALEHMDAADKDPEHHGSAPQFAGCVGVMMHPSARFTPDHVQELDAAAAKLFAVTGGTPAYGDQAMLSVMPYASALSHMAQSRGIPMTDVSQEHGLAGAQFAVRHQTTMAYAEMAQALSNEADADLRP